MGVFQKDLRRYGLKKRNLFKAYFTGHSIWTVFLYRVGNWLFRHHIKLLPDIFKSRAMKRYCCEISPYAKIGGGLFLPHSIGIVVGHEVIAGENLELFQNVTIGSNRKQKNGRCMPKIGDNVSIGTGAVVVGPIIIGDNVVIGANSYVDKDIPDNCFVAGTPAKIIKEL